MSNWNDTHTIESAVDRIQVALDTAWSYAQIDGAWHKMWTIDQMVRILCGSEEEYNTWVAKYTEPFYNEELKCMDHYEWDIGIAP